MKKGAQLQQVHNLRQECNFGFRCANNQLKGEKKEIQETAEK
jgi:hypothetical protein